MKFKEIREKYRSKFPASLVAAAVKIALDMGGNMTGAYKKIEKMKRGLGDDPMVKDALRLANESVNEEALNELNFSYAFFDKQSLNKFMMKALKLKGLEVVDSEKQTGGHFTVRVKADDKKIIAKANSFAIKAMSEWVEETNEGTMAIGIKDKNPKERAKAIAKFKSMLKKDGNKKVGSDAGKKFDYVLDMEVLSDDELADEFANPKNKNMKIIDLLKKHSKRLNIRFESVEEK